MVQSEGSGAEQRRIRRWRSVAEKRRIVELTLEPGASVALVARAHGVNANQVFKWRRAFERGELSEPGVASTSLLPVTVSAGCEIATRASGVYERPTPPASIHVEFPGRALISVESGADPVLLRSILESLRK
jgi:transposase